MTVKHTKDREKTKERIINAIHELLVNEGWQSIGINRVAKQAGVDKVLIYRYFDGLDGALRVYVESDKCWPSVSEILGGSPRDFAPLDRVRTRSTVLKNALKALRARPHTVSLLTWELIETNGFTEILHELRMRQEIQIMELFEREGASAAPIDGIDLLLCAAINYLAMSDTGIQNHFREVHNASGLGWEAIDGAIDRVCEALDFYEAHHRDENQEGTAAASTG